jgi:ABC-type transport system involved in multi-copper enzyme maturation permease subunit
MLSKIFAFEVRYHLTQPLFAITAVIFALLTFGAVTTDGVQIGGSIGNVNRNAPYVIMQFMLIMSLIGVFPTTAFVASSVHRDVEHNTTSLFFSRPIRKRDYLFGRFFGSLLVAILVYFAVAIAIYVGSLMPWLEQERIGAFFLAPYVSSIVYLVIPNLFLAGAIFFSLAALTRNMLYTYSGVVGFFVAYAVSQTMMADLDNIRIAVLLDPFGLGAFAVTTRYWTVYEKNTEVLTLTGDLLLNRLLWVGVGIALLAFTAWRFRMTEVVSKKRKKQQRLEAANEEARPAVAGPLPAARDQRFGGGTSFRQYLHSTWIEITGIVKSIPFLVLLFLGAANIVGNGSGRGVMYGTPLYPVTALLVDAIYSGFLLFAGIIVAFYAGELVWRNRQLRVHEVHDALPVRTWVIWASRLSALAGVVAILFVAAMVTAIGYQMFSGYHNYELPVYLRGLFLVTGIPFLMIATLALFAQVVTNNRWTGLLVVLLYFVGNAAASAMGFEHNLYRFAGAPDFQYSDMNGYGHYVAPIFWFYLYWGLVSLLLVIATHLFWLRGTASGLRERLRIARGRFTRGVAVATALTVIATAATGGWIFYNTNVLNTYETRKDGEKTAADYEKQYKKYENMVFPKITDVKANVEIFPEERRVEIAGEYTLLNKTGRPVTDIHVTVHPKLESTLSIAGATERHRDDRLGYHVFQLATPLQPGATVPMTFTARYAARGFENSGSNTRVVANGTFIDSFEYFPHIGYQRYNELQDRGKRKKHGLGEVERMRKLNDPVGLQYNQISREADWINLKTTVTTSADQIALAPGYLRSETTKNGRRTFVYETEAPILAFWSYLSARYQVKRDTWKGIPIEIYYDEAHPYNVDRMIYAAKKSLDYFTANFSPYQHRQLRILEFPRYATFAQSFPNTIPYSEAIGFIADLRDKKEIDLVFYVTAHEIAHQWWAHQVVGAAVEGTTFVTESMAQYSALMVMEKEYGPHQMRKFLEYELNRYLRGRGGELVEEKPLMLVEDQGYIHYSKGSLVMYALRDIIGEEALNAAIRNWIAKAAFQGPPYTTTPDFMAEVRKATPPERQAALHDLFETITLYDNRATKAAAEKLPDGRYRVKLTVESSKARDDGTGKETKTAIDDWIDIGVLASSEKAEKDEILYLKKHRITQPQQTFTIIVAAKPLRAGIDPLNKLIDRKPDDNTTDVDLTGGS